MAESVVDRIVKTPGTCRGKARISGHRIRVLDIVIWHEHLGKSADEIVSQYPSLTLAEVYAALSYYFDHVDEIQQEMREQHELIEESRRNNRSLIEAKLKQSRLDEASGVAHSIPKRGDRAALASNRCDHDGRSRAERRDRPGATIVRDLLCKSNRHLRRRLSAA